MNSLTAALAESIVMIDVMKFDERKVLLLLLLDGDGMRLFGWRCVDEKKEEGRET